LLLSAIISDTLLLKSPTCTQEDVDAAHELADIADVELKEYGLKMLEAGADISDKTINELLTADAKEFTIGGSKVEIAQVNVVDTGKLYEQQAELESGIKQIIEKKNLELFMFVVTDILNNDSEVLVLGSASGCVEDAFNITLDNNRAVLEGVVSRKKQIVTALTDEFVKVG